MSEIQKNAKENAKQAGAELCQAHASLDLPGFDFIFFDFAGLV